MREQREVKPGPTIPKMGSVQGFSIIVDLNQFTPMVTKAEMSGGSIAQFVRDALSGAILEIEANGGEVVAFMGDAVLGFIPECESAAEVCIGIAKDLAQQCEYISDVQEDEENNWDFAPGGPSIKIAIEFGSLNISTIGSRFLGEHKLFIGSPINYAARISSAGKGNRCIIGPVAVEKEFKGFNLEGPFSIAGKPGEPDYTYFLFPLDDIWNEEPGPHGGKRYWQRVRSMIQEVFSSIYRSIKAALHS